jgi:hypothetical protein
MLLAHERLEVRAFGCLVEEMLVLCAKDDEDSVRKEKLLDLKIACFSSNNVRQPLFKEITQRLKQF